MKALQQELDQAKRQLQESCFNGTDRGTGASGGDEQLKARINALTKLVQDKENRVTKLLSNLKEAQGELKKVNKSVKHEQNGDTLKEAKEYLRDHLFTKVQIIDKDRKKARDAKDGIIATKLTRPIYDALKHALHFTDVGSDYYLEFEDFHRVYQGPLMDYLNDLRCGKGTKLMWVVLGTYFALSLVFFTMFLVFCTMCLV